MTAIIAPIVLNEKMQPDIKPFLLGKYSQECFKAGIYSIPKENPTPKLYIPTNV